MKTDHPEPAKMIEAHQQVVNRARAHIVSKDLMPLQQYVGGVCIY